jgi:quinol monooxygenase YgiN
MITITAVIRVKTGTETTMRKALLQVVEHVRNQEPNTIDFFVSAGVTEPNIFTTYERFADREAMEAHNASQVVKDVHRIAAPILEVPIMLEICQEVASSRHASGRVARSGRKSDFRSQAPSAPPAGDMGAVNKPLMEPKSDGDHR